MMGPMLCTYQGCLNVKFNYYEVKQKLGCYYLENNKCIPHIPRSPGKEYLLFALSCMGEWELDADDDIVLILGDLTACEGRQGRGMSCDTGSRKYKYPNY